MSTVSPIHAAHPPAPTQQREHRTSERAAVEFGAAVTHRDLVEAKLRVEPAAMADRERASDRVRAREERQRDDDDKRQQQRRQRRVDISV